MRSVMPVDGDALPVMSESVAPAPRSELLAGVEMANDPGVDEVPSKRSGVSAATEPDDPAPIREIGGDVDACSAPGDALLPISRGDPYAPGVPTNEPGVQPCGSWYSCIGGVSAPGCRPGDPPHTDLSGVTEAGATGAVESDGSDTVDAVAESSDAVGAAAECDAAISAPPAPTMTSPGR